MKITQPALAALAIGPVGGSLLTAAPASADSGSTTTTTTFTSQSCVAQVKAIAAQRNVDPSHELLVCSGTISVTEAPARVASIADVTAYAVKEHLTPGQTQALLTSAAASAIYYRSWTHAYFSGAVHEVHTGRTYWNGSRAWIASYLGYSGSHTCHAQGSWAAGWTVTPISCSRPSAGSSADAYYRFDESVAFKGSPITLGVGLHYSTAANGSVSTWQVGG